MKKNKYQMPNFEGEKSSSFITKIELDEKHNKIKVFRSDSSIDYLENTKHNWQSLLLQMEQQVLRFLKKNEDLVTNQNRILLNVRLKAICTVFVLMMPSVQKMVGTTGTTQSVKGEAFVNAVVSLYVFYACIYLFVLDSQHNFSKYLQIKKQSESFKMMEAYQYYLQHKDYFSSCEIENENGQVETRELLNINDIAAGNFTLSDLKRICGEEDKLKRKVYRHGKIYR